MPFRAAENLSLVLHVNVLSVDHAFIFLFLLACGAIRGACLRACARSAVCRRRLLRFVHRLSQLCEAAVSFSRAAFMAAASVPSSAFFRIRHGRLNLALFVARNLVAVFLQIFST